MGRLDGVLDRLANLSAAGLSPGQPPAKYSSTNLGTPDTYHGSTLPRLPPTKHPSVSCHVHPLHVNPWSSEVPILIWSSHWRCPPPQMSELSTGRVLGVGSSAAATTGSFATGATFQIPPEVRLSGLRVVVHKPSGTPPGALQMMVK
jgi:hypothetical protein